MTDNESWGSGGETDGHEFSRREVLAMGGVGSLSVGAFAVERHRYNTDPYHPDNYTVDITAGAEYIERIELATGTLELGPPNAYGLEIVIADAFGDGTIYYELQGLEDPVFVSTRERPERGSPDLADVPVPVEELAGEYTLTYYDAEREFERAAEAEDTNGDHTPDPIAESTFTITHNP